jgi:hypothetical protein
MRGTGEHTSHRGTRQKHKLGRVADAHAILIHIGVCTKNVRPLPHWPPHTLTSSPHAQTTIRYWMLGIRKVPDDAEQMWLIRRAMMYVCGAGSYKMKSPNLAESGKNRILMSPYVGRQSSIYPYIISKKYDARRNLGCMLPRRNTGVRPSKAYAILSVCLC